MTSAAFAKRIKRAQRLVDPTKPLLEDEVQKALVTDLRRAGVDFFHCPNEGKLPIQ